MQDCLRFITSFFDLTHNPRSEFPTGMSAKNNEASLPLWLYLGNRPV
jgi:hypothetical protein